MIDLAAVFAGLVLVVGSLFAPVAHPGLADDVSTHQESAPVVPAAIAPNTATSLLDALQRSGYSAEQARSLCESNGGTATLTPTNVSCANIQNNVLLCGLWGQAKKACVDAGGTFHCDFKNVGCVM
jgi:hypothetical protein